MNYGNTPAIILQNTKVLTDIYIYMLWFKFSLCTNWYYPMFYIYCDIATHQNKRKQQLHQGSN